MTSQEQIEIIQAYERGEEIEYKYKCDRDGNNSWFKLSSIAKNHQFNFYDYYYRVKQKRWRAEEGEIYYFIGSALDIEECVDTYSYIDEIRFDAGNYFKTEDKAIEVKKSLKETLTKFHENE